MYTKLKQNKMIFIILAITLIGGFLRFYKLDWGNGLFTHPDEYHIVASVNQLYFPTQMHPHFFSYGTGTIYLIYFTQEMINFLSTTLNSQLSTLNSFLLGRFYSALFSTLTILIVYKICRTFLGTKFSLLAALLVALTPGLIQQAHFSTPESALTFFLFGFLLFIIKFLKQNKILFLILASIFLGFALGVKVSSIVFLLPLLFSIILSTYLKRHSGPLRRPASTCVERGESSSEASLSKISNHIGDSGCAAAYQNDAEDFRSFRKLFRLIILIFASLIVAITTFALVAPFVFLDYSAFRSNLDYEGGLALGKIPVFYTRQFINTTPVLFQIEKILPYALGPLLLILGIIGFVSLIFVIIKKPRLIPTLIVIAFLSLFISNAFLFAKWTRFIAPTFPFFAIFAAFFLQWLSKRTKLLYNSLLIILPVGTILWTTAFSSIYTNRDVRITASKWLESNVKPGSVFLVEGGNMVDLPLRGNFPRISLDFYNLENDPLVRARTADALDTSNYFLVQSRRVFMNHQRLAHLYPKTARFYKALFDGELGFEQIKEFHSYPRLQVTGYKLQVPDEGAEETWSVFDHPVIRVFKKNASLSREEYARFLEN